jgi:3-phosphoshikimate 1-carboxyvinyltransferase
VLGLILKNSQLLLPRININRTRTGLLRVLERMGAKIEIQNRVNDYEPYADLLVTSSPLKGTIVDEEEIPLMIDEVPILCVAAAFAFGRTAIFGVNELKVKETDRINSVVVNLKAAGVNIWAGPTKNKRGYDDYAIIIEGLNPFRPAKFKSFGDHRTAMSMIVLGMASGIAYTLDEVKCIAKSFPEFIPTISKLYESR